MKTIKDKVFTYFENIVKAHNESLNYLLFPQESHIELIDISHTNNVGKISIQYKNSPREIGSISYDFQSSYVKCSIIVNEHTVMEHKNIDYQNDWKEFSDLFYHVINYLGTFKTTQQFQSDIINIENQNLDSLSEIYQKYCSILDLPSISADELYIQILEIKPLFASQIERFLDVWNKVEENEIDTNIAYRSEASMNVEVHHMKINESTGLVEGFEHVANVLVDKPYSENIIGALEYAYRYTNNIDGSWSKKIGSDSNDNVVVLSRLPIINGEQYGLRSSSIGDIFVVNGEEHKISMLGFQKLEEPIIYSDKEFPEDPHPFGL